MKKCIFLIIFILSCDSSEEIKNTDLTKYTSGNNPNSKIYLSDSSITIGVCEDIFLFSEDSIIASVKFERKFIEKDKTLIIQLNEINELKNNLLEKIISALLMK